MAEPLSTHGGYTDGLSASSGRALADLTPPSKASTSPRPNATLDPGQIVAEALLDTPMPASAIGSPSSLTGSMKRMPLLIRRHSGPARSASNTRRTRGSSPRSAASKSTAAKAQDVPAAVNVGKEAAQSRIGKRHQTTDVIGDAAQPSGGWAQMSRTSTEPEPEDGEKVEEMRAQLIEVVRKNNELQRRNEELERKDFERERQMAGEQDFVLQRMYSGPGHEIVEVIGTVPSKASMTAAHLMPMASAPA